MSFQSLSFLLFLAVTAAVCLILRRKSASSALAALELACLVFYLAGGGWQSFLVLAVGVVVTRAAILRLTDPACRDRRRVLALACIWHVAVLLVFKYTGFFTGGALSMGWVPLGLSFFTFQQLWLLKEVYTGAYVPAQDERLFLFAFSHIASRWMVSSSTKAFIWETGC